MTVSVIGETPTTAAGFVKAIARNYAKAADAILECGKLLLKAKERLPHGQFQRMITAELPFQHRQAQRLMEIARHPAIANASNASLLPPSVSALHELSRLPEDQAAAMIAAGIDGSPLSAATRAEIACAVERGKLLKACASLERDLEHGLTPDPEDDETLLIEDDEPPTLSVAHNADDDELPTIRPTASETTEMVSPSSQPAEASDEDPPGLISLKTAWSQASPAAQQAFLDWVAAQSRTL